MKTHFNQQSIAEIEIEIKQRLNDQNKMRSVIFMFKFKAKFIIRKFETKITFGSISKRKKKLKGFIDYFDDSIPIDLKNVN